MFCMCFAKVCLGSNVRPSKLVCLFLFVGSVALFIVSLSFVECFAGCKVNSVFMFLKGLGLDNFVWSSLICLAGMSALAF